MEVENLAVPGVTAVIIIVAVVSGPLVAGFTFSRAPDNSSSGPQTGNATVDVLDTPNTARLERGSFGGDAPYTLLVPEATVRLADITGEPLLVYKIRIPEIGYTRGTTHFLSESISGTRSFEIERANIEDELTKDQYQGELLLLLRGDGPERTLYRGNITVNVVR